MEKSRRRMIMDVITVPYPPNIDSVCICGCIASKHEYKGRLYPEYIHTGKCIDCDCIAFSLKLKNQGG
jgi:hypothetical protein